MDMSKLSRMASTCLVVVTMVFATVQSHSEKVAATSYGSGLITSSYVDNGRFNIKRQYPHYLHYLQTSNYMKPHRDNYRDSMTNKNLIYGTKPKYVAVLARRSSQGNNINQDSVRVKTLQEQMFRPKRPYQWQTYNDNQFRKKTHSPTRTTPGERPAYRSDDKANTALGTMRRLGEPFFKFVRSFWDVTVDETARVMTSVPVTSMLKYAAAIPVLATLAYDIFVPEVIVVKRSADVRATDRFEDELYKTVLGSVLTLTDLFEETKNLNEVRSDSAVSSGRCSVEYFSCVAGRKMTSWDVTSLRHLLERLVTQDGHRMRQLEALIDGTRGADCAGQHCDL